MNFLIAFLIVPNAISDRHALVLAAFDYKKSKDKPPRKRMRCLSKENISAITTSLKNMLSNFTTFIFKNPNEQWRTLKILILSCMDTHAPIKTVPLKSSNNFPWIDKAYIGLSNKRDVLFKAQKYGSGLDLESYKKIRNKCSNYFHKKNLPTFKISSNRPQCPQKNYGKNLALI